MDELVLATHLFRPFRFVYYLAPWNWFGRSCEKESRGVRLRKALEDLGPIFVKFGQLLSTRRDLLPDDIAKELAKLQDQVPPFSPALAKQQIETALEGKIEDYFEEFSESALASASIAQVHAARTKDGREVVIKVLRPNVLTTISKDLEILHLVAALAERYWSDAKRLRPREVVAEYEKTLLDELDLIREAANASQLRRNFKNSPLLYVPEVLMEFSRKNILVIERISGIPISDMDLLNAAGVNLELLSSRGVEIFFTQVFRDNFFHADMHPGNIFVSRDNPQAPQYIAVDFGIVGTLSNSDKKYLAGNFLAFFQRDYRKVAQLHIDSGWVPSSTRVDELEAAVRTVCEPIFEKPLKEISFGHVLLRLFQTARRFQMEVQPQLVLLQKTLLSIEGLGRQLNPDLDLWQTAKPFLEKWVAEQIGVKAAAKNIIGRLPEWGEMVPELPGLAYDCLQQAKIGKLKVQWDSPQLQKLGEEMAEQHRQKIFAITGGSCLIAAAIIFGLDGHQPMIVAGAPVWSWILGAVGGLLLIKSWPD